MVFNHESRGARDAEPRESRRHLGVAVVHCDDVGRVDLVCFLAAPEIEREGADPRKLEFGGRTPVQAAIEASRLRLRPILMTSLAFIMGVLPLVISTGAGSEMRHAMGVAVFSGMIGVTAFGIFFTPMFYVLLRALAGNRKLTQHGEA